MSQTIKLKTSSTPASVPTTGDLVLGELAVNTYDGKLYFKKNDGSDSIKVLDPDNVAPIQTVFGRTGDVVASVNDYSSFYLQDITQESVGDLSDVTVTAPTNGDILVWDGSDFVNVQASENLENVVIYETTNVASMIAGKVGSGASVTQNVGQVWKTAGYTTAGDGGGAFYLIEAPQTVDGAGDHTLSNGNTAILQYEGSVPLAAFGGNSGKGAALAALAAKGKPTDLYTEDAIETVDKVAPLNYIGTRATKVIHCEDSLTLGANGFSPNVVYDLTSSGDGVVNPSIELSESIWQGVFSSFSKTGDGSMHSFTATGQVGTYGSSGYNEGGLFQGELTNVGSNLGTLSGAELLIKDSPDGGVTTYSSKMQGLVSRIAKYDPTIRKSTNLYASSEGAIAVNSIISTNPSGLASWQEGIDFSDATFTTGRAILLPNNTSLAWKDAANASKSVLFMNNLNETYLAMGNNSASINLVNADFNVRFQVTNSATDAVNIFVGGALKNVGQGLPDSAGTGFRNLVVPN